MRIARMIGSLALVLSMSCAGSADPEVADDSEALIGSGCSYVQYCNAAGTIGTQCVQRGCSLAAAQAECKREVPLASVCDGPPVCPFMFLTTSKQNIKLNCNGAQCSGGAAIACGGVCCSTSATFCSSSGACCDGTCRGDCPC